MQKTVRSHIILINGLTRTKEEAHPRISIYVELELEAEGAGIGAESLLEERSDGENKVGAAFLHPSIPVPNLARLASTLGSLRTLSNQLQRLVRLEKDFLALLSVMTG